MPDPTLRSRRTLSLRFNIPISKTAEFWGSLKKGKLTTWRCSACGAEAFPPQADCPSCMGTAGAWVELQNAATLVTYTEVRVPPASFASLAPYTVAIGELVGGLKVLAWLEGMPFERVKPRMKLKLEARESSEGNWYYVFVPG